MATQMARMMICSGFTYSSGMPKIPCSSRVSSGIPRPIEVTGAAIAPKVPKTSIRQPESLLQPDFRTGEQAELMLIWLWRRL